MVAVPELVAERSDLKKLLALREKEAKPARNPRESASFVVSTTGAAL
jgi:hypothetical protein